jgi:hypothetical protein
MVTCIRVLCHVVAYRGKFAPALGSSPRVFSFSIQTADDSFHETFFCVLGGSWVSCVRDRLPAALSFLIDISF